MDTSSKLNDFHGCAGILKGLATPDNTARRRHSNEFFLDQLDLDPNNLSPFEIDLILIRGSQSFRRLEDKTQVQTARTNGHIRSRLAHTLEVANISLRISAHLGLNRRLSEAASLGHDIGHTPFGHLGECFISSKLTNKEKFRHDIFGVILAQQIERKGRGLNLSYQTLRAMRWHSRGKKEMTTTKKIEPEANVVMIGDKIAYTIADISDIFYRKALALDDYPQIKSLLDQFGHTKHERTSNLIKAICLESAEAGEVQFEESELARTFSDLRVEMNKIYPKFDLFNGHELLGKVYDYLNRFFADENINPLVALALMTDEDIFFLNNQRVLDYTSIKETSTWDIIETLRKVSKTIDFTKDGLDW